MRSGWSRRRSSGAAPRRPLARRSRLVGGIDHDLARQSAGLGEQLVDGGPRHGAEDDLAALHRSRGEPPRAPASRGELVKPYGSRDPLKTTSCPAGRQLSEFPWIRPAPTIPILMIRSNRVVARSVAASKGWPGRRWRLPDTFHDGGAGSGSTHPALTAKEERAATSAPGRGRFSSAPAEPYDGFDSDGHRRSKFGWRGSINKEGAWACTVVLFENVSKDRIEELKREMASAERPPKESVDRAPRAA